MNARQRRKARRAWARPAEWWSFGRRLDTIELTQEELDKLPEYSTTIPTGAGPGKTWKSDLAALHRYALRRDSQGAQVGAVHVPRFVREVWFHHVVTEQDHPKGGKVIRSRRVRRLQEPRRLYFVAGNTTGKSGALMSVLIKELPPRLAAWADPLYTGRRRLPRRAQL